ncbi:MAG TPA: hypothetical protein VN449_01470 [Gaiellaceae bacterium]|nr:hypothetical protein [Gaiellaceae bacterium]
MVRMFGTVRGTFTLVGAAAAGTLIWISTQIGQGTTGGYWAAIGVLAGAGLTMALSQLFGGWTKWGMPRISAGVFLIGFLPVLVAAGWVILAGQPDANWFQRHVTSWSSSISVGGLVDDLRTMLPVLAFGVGLVFGFTFDTTGPRRVGEPLWESSAPPTPAATPGPVETVEPAHEDAETTVTEPEPVPEREHVHSAQG